MHSLSGDNNLVPFHPKEYNQKVHYYSFEVKLDRCVGSCMYVKKNMFGIVVDVSVKMKNI